MKKQILFLILMSITFLLGCSKKDTFDNFFSSTMNEIHKGETDYSYSLIYKEFNVVHENDAIAVFTENKEQEEIIYIAYFEKIKGIWNWYRTSGTKWDSPINWSSMSQFPHIYSGAIDNKDISEIYVGNSNAEIIEIKDTKIFWYAVSDSNDAQVMVVKSDGTQEVLKQMEDGWMNLKGECR